jgi:putative ABC transport system permease protein
VLFRRRAADAELREEFSDYVARAAEDFQSQGMTPEHALRAAHVHSGTALHTREQVRSAGWEHRVHTTLGDVRVAARRLRRDRSFSVVTILTLAVGIGASTAIFSAIDPILLRPLPYPHAERVVMVTDVNAAGGPLDVTYGNFREVHARVHAFSVLAVSNPWQPTVTGTGDPQRLVGQAVSAEYFDVLGVHPALGRTFVASDDQPNGPREVILSDGLWRRRFGGDRGIVGRAVLLDGMPYAVLGVMPASFDNVLVPDAEAWTPLQYATSFGPDSREWGHHLKMIGRLRPGLTAADAEREILGVARTPTAEFARVPWSDMARGLTVHSLQDDVTGGVRPALIAVACGVMLLLLMVIVNVTNLLLARGAQRRGELAMRAALGAGRMRIAGQLLTESVLLALVGGALGLIVARAGVRALVALSPAGVPRLGAVSLDARAFAFAALVSAVVGLLVGIVPALHGAGGDLRASLHESTRRAAGGHQGVRRILVIAEVALALMLLACAGLLLRSVRTIFAVPPGFDPSHVLAMQIQTAGPRLADDSIRERYFENVLAAVRQLPGVESAAFTSLLPLAGGSDSYGVHLEGSTSASADQDGAALRYAVTADYLRTMHIPLERGRGLDRADAAGVPIPVVVSASFARSAFPGADPIGRRFHFGPAAAPQSVVVGVVADVKQQSLLSTEASAVYLLNTRWQWLDRALWLVVRTSGEPAALTAPVKKAIWSVDGGQPIVNASTMTSLVTRSEADRRFALTVFEAFALAALALAAIGIYGVLSGGVTERMREMGVRSALGASGAELLRLVVSQGMMLSAIGVVLGLVGAAFASRTLVSLLFGISPLDPATYGSAVVVLLMVAGAACWFPARRAARVDPAITLRSD